MARDNFEACMAVVAHHEGGWSNHPSDPGGATMCGVTQRVYDEFRRRSGQTPKSVKFSTEAERGAIYREQYWDKIRGDELPAGLDLVVFDYAVNSGPSRAVKALQAALGLKIDGQLGMLTVRAAQEAAATGHSRVVIDKIMDSRDAFLRGLGTFGVFGVGWMRRTKDVRFRAQVMATKERRDEKSLVMRAADASAFNPDEMSAPPQPARTARQASGWAAVSAVGAGVAGAASQAKELVGDVLPVWAVAAVLTVVVVIAAVVAWKAAGVADASGQKEPAPESGAT